MLYLAEISDTTNAWYAGFNYYMMNRAVKFSAGYEFIRFEDRHSGNFQTLIYNGTEVFPLNINGFTTSTVSSVDPSQTHQNNKTHIHIFRARLQLVF